jgi:hypothetical protein
LQHKCEIRKLASTLVSDKQEEKIVQNGDRLLDDIITPSWNRSTVNIIDDQKDGPDAFDKDTDDDASDIEDSSSSSAGDADASCSSWSHNDPTIVIIETLT